MDKTESVLEATSSAELPSPALATAGDQSVAPGPEAAASAKPKTAPSILYCVPANIWM
jgi:hypothetical protein